MVKIANAGRAKSLREIEDLIDRVALGDNKAFSALYNATHMKLFHSVLAILHNSADADDVVQMSYIKIWRYAGRYCSNGMSPMTWLLTITRNTTIDHIRTTRTTVDIDCVVGYLTAPGLNPEQSMIASDEARRIVSCLGKLKQDRAAAVRGVYMEGRSYADLAETLNVPLNTIRSQLHRSLKSLQVHMAN